MKKKRKDAIGVARRFIRVARPPIAYAKRAVGDLAKTFSAACLVFLLFLAPDKSHAQEEIRTYVQQHTHPVRSIDPDSVNYEDLEAIGKAIGDAKLVMLGEQDHGDAPTFLAKSRLIEYLHEQKGFNVLAFESDFFGLNEGWDRAKKSEAAVDSFLKENIYPLWTACDACQQLFFGYIPSEIKKGDPLEVTGFDNQMNSRHLFPELDSLMRALQIPLALLPQYASEILPLIEHWGSHMQDSVLHTQYLGYLAEIREELASRLPKDDFWLQVIDNLIAEDFEYQHLHFGYWLATNTRDRRMALNLKWLNEVKYPQEKIIVWSHSFHVSKYAGHYPEGFMNAARPMGSVFTSDPGVMEKTYIIGFTSYEGTSGRLFSKIKYGVDAPKANSFEKWIARGYDYAFVDFKPFNLAHPEGTDNFNMSGATVGNFFHKNTEAQWNRIFDGVFFVRKMYPCKKVE